MYNFLPQATADVTEILAVNPQKVMPNPGRKNQIVHSFEDGRKSVVGVSASSLFEVELQWAYISDEDRSTIFDLFHNDSKANGSANTFYWAHPIDNVAYIARFLTPLRTVYKPGIIASIETLKLKVSAYYGQAFSTYTDMALYVESGTYMDFI